MYGRYKIGSGIGDWLFGNDGVVTGWMNSQLGFNQPVLMASHPHNAANQPKNNSDGQQAGDTEQLMRLVGPQEAALIQSQGGFVASNNSAASGRPFGGTRVFSPSDLSRMLGDPAFNNRTHLVTATVQPGWRAPFYSGGALISSDGRFGYTVAVPEINGFLVGPPAVTIRP